jgi:hypothetical protein
MWQAEQQYPWQFWRVCSFPWRVLLRETDGWTELSRATYMNMSTRPTLSFWFIYLFCFSCCKAILFFLQNPAFICPFTDSQTRYQYSCLRELVSSSLYLLSVSLAPTSVLTLCLRDAYASLCLCTVNNSTVSSSHNFWCLRISFGTTTCLSALTSVDLPCLITLSYHRLISILCKFSVYGSSDREVSHHTKPRFDPRQRQRIFF